MGQGTPFSFHRGGNSDGRVNNKHVAKVTYRGLTLGPELQRYEPPGGHAHGSQVLQTQPRGINPPKRPSWASFVRKRDKVRESKGNSHELSVACARNQAQTCLSSQKPIPCTQSRVTGWGSGNGMACGSQWMQRHLLRSELVLIGGIPLPSLRDFYLIWVRVPGAKAAPSTEEVSHYHHLVATTATAGAPSPKGRPG